MSDSASILQAFQALVRDKRLTEDELFQLVEEGIHAALSKHFGGDVEAEITFHEDGDIDMLVLKEVVEEVEDPAREIALEEARWDDPDTRIGDLIEFPVDFEDFGRHAVGAAKQRIVQGVTEEEREKVQQQFADRIGELIAGEVQRVERGKIVVMVREASDVEAFIPRSEQNSRERFRQGEPIRAALKKLEETPRGPRLILSRGNEAFVARLFELEVPEIAEGLVQIRAIARQSGGRTKLAVSSSDESIDAVGACVGVRGSRVQAVVSELGGERVDIIPWHPDPEILAKRAMAPADVDKAIADPERGTVTLILPDDQMSLGIGRGGQNVRLASDLVGWTLDVYGATEWRGRQDAIPGVTDEDLSAGDFPLSELPEIPESVVNALNASGYHSFFSILDLTEEDFAELPGIDPDEAADLDALLDELTITEEEEEGAA